MELPPFSVTYDYRCPFARNAHEHLLDALAEGAPWEVTFLPFSLSQVHVGEGDPPIWDLQDARPDLLALEASVVVRERFPERFLATHRALFAARHDEGGDLRDREVVRRALEAAGTDPEAVLAEVDKDWARLEVRKAHEEAVQGHAVFGVPTFVVNDHAAFVRLMNRPEGDGRLARDTVERVVRLLVDHPELNEFKHTKLSR
jgi:hypothetical protein